MSGAGSMDPSSNPDPEADSQPLLEVDGLRVGFPTHAGLARAVDGVSSVSYTHLTLPTKRIV